MHNMKLMPAQSQEEYKEEGNDLWALPALYLNDEAMLALGITEPLKVGTMLALNCVAKVVATEQREDHHGESENCMYIQITDMDMAPQVKKIDARLLFPKSKMEE